MTLKEEVNPICHFEDMDPADLLTAVKSISPKRGTCLIHDRLGAGFETFLDWSLRDIETAAATQESGDQRRHATNAVMSARRSLSCLVDQYLVRDCVSLCRDAPKEPAKQADVLVRRGVMDALTANVLERAIRKRNLAEHEYQALALEEAEDIVQTVRATVESVAARSSPYEGPCCFGTFSHG